VVFAGRQFEVLTKTGRLTEYGITIAVSVVGVKEHINML
jgi:hypothetical protein